jgi:DNA repair exonuclease SbcCD nuclease subunit
MTLSIIMKRYFLKAVILITLVFVTGCTTIDNNRKVIHTISNPSGTATIQISDLSDSLRVMQITDIHISIAAESEADLMKYGDRMQKAYTNPRKHYSQDISKTTFEYLDDLLLQAKNENIDLLVLTVDIVNFPSAVSVKYVYDKLEETGIPWLYISGNHDWHYEGMPGGIDSLRTTWINKSLLPLYSGHNPLFYSDIINGINFVGIDNSTGEINDEQLKFLEEQLRRSEPIFILSHIPYNFNTPTDQPGMAALINIISSNTDKIAGILAGHIHRSTFYFTGNMCQYTSIASFQGASFIYNIKSYQPVIE